LFIHEIVIARTPLLRIICLESMLSSGMAIVHGV
jgi:hypothetical protein